MTGRRIYGYVMDEIYDIDNEIELERACRRLEMPPPEGSTILSPNTFVFDIDGVVASFVPSLDYALAKPNPDAIKAVNFLYEKGHRIVLFTARGTKTGQDWQETTRRQMADWGVKYHELLFGKPAGDYYVDDKALSVHRLAALTKLWGLPP
jgi:CMP-N,N'-diacetyllegionaminic acid synthase